MRNLDQFRTFLEKGMPGPHAYVVLLGLTQYDFPGLIEKIEHGLPYSAFERLQKNTRFSTEQLLDLLQIPRRTLARRKTAGRFSSEESDRLVRLARVYGRTLYFFDGDSEAATEWLTTTQYAFGGIRPIEMLRSDVGAQEVETLIGQLEHGIFA
ncbi:MAG TPA: antitoxin Xre-like helix-turn-helix domain-containing protein [Thermoanaerobaculia bacterium]|jgi:putative toxin-antitoxin system antitoxin component (TIGR02293 family)|nr:antitoxin Xre-like helix-turn-helix domain-containing protein [Thermoanaerobaculia bacterium]